MQSCLKGQRLRPFNAGFQPRPSRVETSLDSLKLLFISWIIDGDIYKFIAIVQWEMLFFNCCPWSDPRLILAYECLSRKPLSTSIVILPPVTSSLSVLDSNRCFLSMTQLSVFCWHNQQNTESLKLFWDRHQIVYLQKTTKFTSLSSKSLCTVFTWI